jgi:hypothetical protein
MLKKDESGGLPRTETPAESGADSVPAFRAVEEHAAEMKVSAPVFAAVRQANGWAAGKKVERSDFEKAVKGFLNAPMGGR